MDALIAAALSSGRKTLSEHDSKLFLQKFGIPVTREKLTHSDQEAADAADALGGPVALKACSPELLHKTESGCVELALRSSSEVRAAYRRIMASATVSLDGVLVQEMIAGVRELGLGLMRDAQFGPCVMFGLGGVMAEVFRDTVFRVAPFDRMEAVDMLEEFGAKTLLEAFRGQAPADREVLCNCLQALGRIGLEVPQVLEIDVNPVIIDPRGRVVAVDALVILEGR
jgi:succinyl-CoA synthetase beta subunit